MIETIDKKTWPRKPLFDLFEHNDFPFYETTCRVDVTDAFVSAKEKRESVFLTVLHAVMTAANAVPAFRTRVSGERIYRYDTVSPSTTADAGDDLFKIVTFDFDPSESRSAFICRARACIDAQSELVPPEEAQRRDDLVYNSCLPWLDFTSLTNEMSFDRDDTIPRIAWGKITERDGRYSAPFSVEVNHRVVDGKDLGKFFAALEAALSDAGRSPRLKGDLL